MSLESKIVFERKVADMEISGDTFLKMKAKGWDSLGNFAFCCSATPGAGANGEAFDAVAKDLASDEREVPALRRLYFEAWITSSAELKYRLERRDGDPPRRMPDVERNVRKAELRSLLGEGLSL